MKPKIAAFLQPQHAEYDQLRNAAVAAENMGVDVIYNWDHFYPHIKKMVLIGTKEREERVNILSAGQCLQVGQRLQIMLKLDH